MKKLLVAAAVTGLVGTVNAQSAFEGFYGQVGVGYESVDLGISNDVVSSGEAYTFSSSNANSFTGSVGIGAYFPVTKTFLLGAGAEYSPFAGSSTNAIFNIPTVSYTSTTSWKKKNSYNIFLSPAIAVDKDKLAYAKVGFTGMSTHHATANGTQSNDDYTGYSLGLGYKQMVSRSIYAFGEVNYSTYGSKEDDFSLTNKPSTMNALVGVGYKF